MVADFGKNRSQKDGLTDYCKSCHNEVMRENRAKNHGSTRNYHLKRRCGITEDDFERMLARQGGLCAICQVVPGVFVDHCHATGLVRGVLCFNCDNGLGHFGDNTVLLELAALYLDGEILWPEFRGAASGACGGAGGSDAGLSPEVEVTEAELLEPVAAEERLRAEFYAVVTRVG